MSEHPGILALNSGSSSIKFALYAVNRELERKMSGSVDRIGSSNAELRFEGTDGKKGSTVVPGADHGSAASFLLDWLRDQDGFASVEAVGHRVVQGLEHTQPEIVTQELLEDLRRITVFDPDHLPAEINLIEGVRGHHPKLTQVACFDTGFHRTMPRVAKILPIPRRYEIQGMRRYGFHGLSYAYLMEELERLGHSKGRIILAHLGNGASMAAVLDGQSLDTTMGFTPAAGLIMGTRTGDIDPGIVAFLARSDKMTAPQFNRLINHESGLLGISETSSDMQVLLAEEATDIRAAEAVALFCYQAKKWIGAYAAVLNGLDTLVFAGGIGENSPVVRSRICAGLGYLGLSVDEVSNAAAAPTISSKDSQVTVRVIRTNEQYTIAKSVYEILPDALARKPQNLERDARTGGQ
jgi:acetate kinase